MTSFLEEVGRVLRYPLVELSGSPITLGSLLTCLMVFLAAALVGRIAARGIQRAFVRRGQPEGVAAAVAKIVRYAIITIGLLMAINTVGININALIAGSAVLLVGIGFGLQNIASNFISGVIILVERPVKKGDFIAVGENIGAVQDIGMRATKVITRDEVTVLIPNSDLITNAVTNNSVPTPKLRVHVEVGVAYGSDTAKVREILLAVAADHEQVLSEPPPMVLFDAFGSSSLDFTLMVWITDLMRQPVIMSELRFAIDQGFRDGGVEIPFPQRDLHLKSSNLAQIN